VDKRSHDSINSPENVDKRYHGSKNVDRECGSTYENLDRECGSSDGHVGEVSPSKCSDMISLDMRSGELSPVHESSDGVGSLEAEQLRFHDMSLDPNPILGEDLLESKVSNNSPLRAPVRTFSKESPSTNPYFSPGGWQVNCSYQMRGKNFVEENKEGNDISTRVEHPSKRLAHPTTPDGTSNSNNNPIFLPEGPSSWSVLDLLEKPVFKEIESLRISNLVSDSNVGNKNQVKVPVRSAPCSIQSPVCTKQNNRINGQTGYTKKIEELLGSWEVFLRNLKNLEQTPTDLMKTIESYLQRTKIEVGLNGEELERAFNGTSNVDIGKFRSSTILGRLRNSLKCLVDQSLEKTQFSVSQSQQLCQTDLNSACCPSIETFLHKAESRSAYSENGLDLPSKRAKDPMRKSTYEANKPGENLKTTAASKRGIALKSPDIGNVDLTSHESREGYEMKLKGQLEEVGFTKAEHIYDKKSEGNTLALEQSLTTDSADSSWSESGIESSSQSNLKRNNSLVKMSSDEVTSTVNDVESVQHSLHNGNPLSVNPNKGNLNLSSMVKSCPNKQSQIECKPHTPDPVRICSNSNTDYANGERDPLSPGSEKVNYKDELSNANQEISYLADFQEHLVVRSDDERNTSNEEAKEPPQTRSELSVRSVCSRESRHLERGNQN